MAPPKKPKSGRENALQGIRVRLKLLEKEHESMQQEYRRLYNHHGERCAVALRASIESLFEVIIYVREADKDLVDWHCRSKGLKKVLRMDRRTHVMIEKKTQKLHDEVQRVEQKFDQTSHVFDGRLQDAKRMRTGFLQFSTDNVEIASQQLVAMHDAYDEEYERVDAILNQQRSENQNIRSETKKLNKSLKENEQNSKDAQESMGSWSVGMFGGLGVAAASALFFPPSLLVTGGSLAASAFAASNAMYDVFLAYMKSAKDWYSSCSEKVQKLERQKNSLASSLSEHQASVKALQTEVNKSIQTCEDCWIVMEEVEQYQDRIIRFRKESQKSLNELYCVQISLNKVQDNLRIISKQLHECRYEDSRRGIAKKLQDILRAIGSVPKQVKSASEMDIGRATRDLTEMDDKTAHILQIARLSAFGA
ncbi:hypothetical protein ACLMJK_006189 [Lecanora helva]